MYSSLTFLNGTLGNNQEGFVLRPPDGVAIGGHVGIYSNKVGCNVQLERMLGYNTA